MAIVKTLHFGNRSACFDDTYLRGVPKEEIQHRIQNMQEAAGELLYKQQLRNLEAKKGAETD